LEKAGGTCKNRVVGFVIQEASRDHTATKAGGTCLCVKDASSGIMNDLLADSSYMGAGGINFNSDIELGTAGAPADAGQDMSLFFSEVNDIKNGMIDIRKKFQKLQS
jgi:hypothetical protein